MAVPSPPTLLDTTAYRDIFNPDLAIVVYAPLKKTLKRVKGRKRYIPDSVIKKEWFKIYNPSQLLDIPNRILVDNTKKQTTL